MLPGSLGSPANFSFSKRSWGWEKGSKEFVLVAVVVVMEA